MVQRLPAAPPKGPSFSQKLSNAVGAGLEAYSQIQKGQQEEQQYQSENETYKKLTGRDLSKNPKTREMEIEYALKGQSEQQKEERKYKSKAEEQAAKLRGEEKINKELSSFADRLESNNPNSPVHKTIADIYRTELPMDQKTKLVQSLTGVDPFKVEQQKRLQLDSVLKRYNSRLKELDDEIKNVRNPSSAGREEVDTLRKQRMALRGERDQLLDFRALNGMEDEEEGFEDALGEDEEEIEGDEGPSVKFDQSNPKHKAVAAKLYAKYKDKEKVREILKKSFKGL